VRDHGLDVEPAVQHDRLRWELTGQMPDDVRRLLASAP
jgi:hypothetical protein